MSTIQNLTCASLVACGLALGARAQERAPERAAAEAEAPREATMLQLHDGAILWGSIVGHDAQSLHVLRLDTGGRVRLPWAHLAPALSEQLLDRFGYVDRSGEEVRLEAARLILHDGRDLVARILDETPDAFLVKTATSTFRVPKLQVKAPPALVTVNALELFTRDELYKAELVNLDATSPQSNWDLAIYCERIDDYAHAVEHLEAARTLDASFRVSELAAALERNRAKVGLQSQVDALREVDSLRARGRFDDAVRAADAFIASFEDSPLRTDATKKKAQVIKARDAKLKERVTEAWHRWLPRLIDQKARQSTFTLEAALEWVDQGLKNELIENVSAEVAKSITAEATPDVVKRHWVERAGGRWRSASYGSATWLLGEADARKGLDDKAAAAAKPTSEADQARKQIEEQVKRYLQNQEILRKAQSSAAGGEDEANEREAYWAGLTSITRSQWLLAYYVEHSGDYQLKPPIFTECSDCGGRGVRETVNARGGLNGGGNQGAQVASGGQVMLSKCPACHHIGVYRRVMYR
ncbi:MAG: hypothetical protein JNN27_22600 [Planctomycetes bacterium]|nr:hypothetical protein [Planctomycetota bacterium]